MLGSNIVEIHEFSRGFDNPHYSPEYGKWVSGGFAQEIAASTPEVPLRIKTAVNQGDFKIYDAYPPKNGDYALLARDIDEYSVLAVATGEVDDKGKRPLVAYRYFWLEKPNQNIDGIGTLLNWWRKQGEPRFEFPDSSPFQTPHHSSNYTTIDYSLQSFQQHLQVDSRIESEFISLIKHYPYAFSVLNKQQYFSRTIVHYITLSFHQQYRTPLAWAWNVDWLEQPNKFTLIYCASEEAYQRNLRYIKQQPLTIPASISTPSQSQTYPQTQPATSIGWQNQQNQEQSQTYFNNTSDFSKPTTLTETDWHNIKECLNRIANPNNANETPEKIKQMLDFLEQYPSQYWEWNKVEDQQIKRNDNSLDGMKYRALLVLLGYIEVPEWLKLLKEKKNRQYETASLKLQSYIFQLSKEKKANAYAQLQRNVYEGISQLLLNYQSEYNNFQKQNIKWLVLDSNSIWKKKAKEYARTLCHQLDNKVEDVAGDEFYGQLLIALNNWEQSKQQKNPYRDAKYRELAQLFSQLPNYSLSAFFYQLSEGSVPSEVYSQVDTGIIELTEKKSEREALVYSFINFLLSQIWKSSGWLVVIMIISSLLINYFTVSIITNNQISKTEEFIPDDAFEGKFLFWYMKGNKTFQKDIDNQINAFTEYIFQDTKKTEKPDNYSYIYGFIKTYFIPQPTLETKVEDLYKEREKANNDIKIVQQVLKDWTESNKFTDIQAPEVNGFFDEKTEKAVKKINSFLCKQCQEPNKLNSKTWEKISSLWVNRKVKPAAFLINQIFEKQDNQNIKYDINEMRTCQTSGVLDYSKKDGLSYSDCIKKISKKYQKN